MFLTGRNNQFRFEFPRTFVPKEIADKYRPYINRMPGSMIKEPIDLLNYTIQSINLPGPSYDPVTQTDFPGNSRSFKSAQPFQQNFDKALNITCKAIDGYLNYWMCIEIFNYYYSLGGNKNLYVPSPIGIQMLDAEGNNIVTAHIDQLIFNAVGALDLNFSSNTVEFQTFELNFTYNILDIRVNII